MLDELDRRILLALRNPGDLSDPIGPQWLQRTAIDLTALGSHTVLVLVALSATALLVLARRRADAFWVLVAMAGAIVLNFGLKVVFARARPDLVEHLVLVVTPSFPSGHALMSAAVYGTIAGLLGRGVSQPQVRSFLLGGAALLTLMIGLSRVYLGVHWPSDVLGGWIVGSLWACSCVRLSSRA